MKIQKKSSFRLFDITSHHVHIITPQHITTTATATTTTTTAIATTTTTTTTTTAATTTTIRFLLL